MRLFVKTHEKKGSKNFLIFEVLKYYFKYSVSHTHGSLQAICFGGGIEDSENFLSQKS
jgi:hypothetical protein